MGALPTDNDEGKKELEKLNAKKARSLSKGDEYYFFIGSIGAVLAGLMFPGWGVSRFAMSCLLALFHFCLLTSWSSPSSLSLPT
jgi:hypothetical protein